MGPGAVGMAATQVNVFVNTLLATNTVEGAVSWLNYAFRLMYLPIGLFGVSIATATLPTVSRQSTERRLAGGPPDGQQRPLADADAERPVDCRSDRAGAADRPGPARARRVHRRRHAGDSGGAAVLCPRAHRLLGRAHRVTGVLRAGTQSHTSRRQRGHRARERGAQPHARAGARLPRARARNVDRRALQRRDAALPAPFAIWTASTNGGSRRGGADRARVCGDGRCGVGMSHAFSRPAFPSPAFAAAGRSSRRHDRRAVLVLAAAAWLLRIREFNEGVALVRRRLARRAR